MAIVGALAQNSSRCERTALRCAIGGIGLFISAEFREDGLLSYAVPLAETQYSLYLPALTQRRHW